MKKQKEIIEMKKAMSLFLALGMTAALLAGCGNNNSAPAATQAFFDFATSTAANDLIRAAGAVPAAK